MYLNNETYKHYVSLFREAEQTKGWTGQLDVGDIEARKTYYLHAIEGDEVIIKKLAELDKRMDFDLAHQNTDGGEFDE